MTIEQKALELVNGRRDERGSQCLDNISLASWHDLKFALDDALEAHELANARHAAELREQAERFSEAAVKVDCWLDGVYMDKGEPPRALLSPFILAPVDPLVEAIGGLWTQDNCKAEHMARGLRAALESRGLAIVKKEAVNG